MRTYDEIYQSIVDKKENTPELSALTSTSKVAVWKLIAHLTATAIYAFENILYQEKADLEKQLYRKKYGFIEWYADQALQFQYGDSLAFDSTTGVFAYPQNDPTKKIIAKASASENQITARINIKVAKESSGELVKLDTQELAAFLSYINAIKVAGTNIQVISADADIINVNGTVKYNSQYALSEIKSNINKALLRYKTELNYNGIVRRNDLIATIRQAVGVVDFIPSVVSGQPQGNGENAQTIVDDYETYSGYFNYVTLNPENNFTYLAL